MNATRKAIVDNDNKEHHLDFEHRSQSQVVHLIDLDLSVLFWLEAKLG